MVGVGGNIIVMDFGMLVYGVNNMNDTNILTRRLVVSCQQIPEQQKYILWNKAKFVGQKLPLPDFFIPDV